MANSNGWGDGSANNAIGWGQGANNATGWGSSQATSFSGLTNIVGGVPLDVDASAFITAAAITDATQQSAIDTLVTGLKTDGIWTKMKAIYPFIGGTASSHKYNLKDPRDLDAAFRLSFLGGWTHSSLGSTANGTNGYANTFYTPSVNATLNSHHLSFYSRTNTALLQVEMGCTAVGITDLLQINYAGLSYFVLNSTSVDSYVDANSLGYYLANRTASNDADLFKSAAKVKNGTITTSSRCTFPMFLGAYNIQGTTAYYTTKQCAFSTIGDGLTDTDAANLYTRVQAFQTTLSRAII